MNYRNGLKLNLKENNMAEFKCPNCDLIIEANRNANGKVACPKCLESYGKLFIMLEESNGSNKNRNLGGGFFERDDNI